MKMLRWFLRGVFLLLIALALIGTPPSRASTYQLPLNSFEEHPWDILKSAYRVEIIAITDEYIILAVWFTKEQVNPTIIRIYLTGSGGFSPRRSIWTLDN